MLNLLDVVGPLSGPRHNDGSLIMYPEMFNVGDGEDGNKSITGVV